MIYLKLTIAFLLASFSTNAQTHFCGTTVPKDYNLFIESIRQNKIYSSKDCIERTLSISVHLVAPDTNRQSPNINIPTSIQIIEDAITNLNSFFEPICLSFKICSVDTILGSDYYNLEDLSDYHGLLSLNNNIPKTINMYFVGSFPQKPWKAGEATMPDPNTCIAGGEGFIYIKYQSISSSIVIPHEMGHYFGLVHTFQSGEFVNGSNCLTAGDFICDTNADPYDIASLSDPNSTPTVDANCHYIEGKKDINGDFYVPPVSNLMSYYTNCACRFTHEQYLRMALTYFSCRNFLK